MALNGVAKIPWIILTVLNVCFAKSLEVGGKDVKIDQKKMSDSVLFLFGITLLTIGCIFSFALTSIFQNSGEKTESNYCLL